MALRFLFAGIALAFSATAAAQTDPQAAARAQARSLLEEAAALLAELPQSKEYEIVHINLAASLARAGSIPRALEYTRGIEPAEARGFALATISRQLAHDGETVAAREIAAAITDFQRRANALQEIATLQAQRRDFTGALATAAEVESLSPLAHQTYNRIAFFQFRAGDASGAAATLRRAVEWDSGQPFTPADGPAATRRFSRLAEIASMQSRVGDAAGAGETLRRMRELHEQIADRRVQELVARDVARAYVAAGDSAGARAFLHTIEDPEMRDRALAWIATQQAAAGDLPSARHTVAAIEQPQPEALARRLMSLPQAQAGDVPGSMETALAIRDPTQRAQTLLTLASSLASRGQLSPALEALDRALEASRDADPQLLSPNFLSGVAGVQAMAGRLVDAQSTARGILDEAARAGAVARIAAIQAFEGDTQGALGWAHEHTSPVVRAWALISIADGILARAERQASRR